MIATSHPRITLPAIAIALMLTTPPLVAQPPGIIVIQPSPTLSASESIQACIDTFGGEAEITTGPTSSRHLGGTCDARALRGGDFTTPIALDVDNVRLVLGAGVYNVLDSGVGLTISAENVTVEGQGALTELNASTRMGTTPVIDMLPSGPDRIAHVTLRDFRLTGNKALAPPSALNLIRSKDVDSVRIENLEVTQASGTCITVREAVDAVIADNRVSACAKSGIRLMGDVEYAQVRGNTIDDIGSVVDSGNQSDSGTSGILLLGANGLAPRFVRVTDNTVVDSSNGVRARAFQNGLPSDLLLAVNTIGATRSGAIKEGEGIRSQAKNTQIVGNRITGSREHGIRIEGDDADNIALVGNTISNTSQSGSTDDYAIELDLGSGTQTQVLVTGNVAFDDQTPQTQAYLIGASATTGTVEDLLVGTNVGDGSATDGPIEPTLAPLAATVGNLPVTPPSPE